MPIKNFTTGEVSYLISYEPFVLPSGLLEPTSISEMFSVDVIPNVTTVRVNYNIGAESSYTFSINLKNLTNNTVLDVQITPPSNVFILNHSLTTEIQPEQQKKIDFIINKQLLNLQASTTFQAKIMFEIKNRSNGSIITKNINVSRLPQSSIPGVITIS